MKALQTRVLVMPVGWEMVRSVMERIPAHAPPAPQPASGMRYGAGVSLGLHLGVALLGAVAFSQPAQEVAPSPDGARNVRVRLLADIRREAVKGYPVIGKVGEIREVNKPGEELVGWEPVQAYKDATLPYAPRGGFGGAIVSNDFGVYKRFAPVHGTVVIDMWVRAPIEPVNAIIGLLLDNDGRFEALQEDMDGDLPLGLVRKDEGNRWFVEGPGGARTYLSHVAPEGERLRMVYRTREGPVDVSIDGKLLAKRVVVTYLQYRRLPVAGVWMSSGRGDVGAEMEFREMRASARGWTAWIDKEANPKRRIT